MTKLSISNESRQIKGHVLDCALQPILGDLKRYDAQLYLKWNSKKNKGRGAWELRRKPELKTVKEGYSLETPKGRVLFPGDVHPMEDCTIVVPKYHESAADCVKTFDYLDYRVVEWVAEHDLWKFGHKGKDFAKESDYLAAKYEEKIDEESYAEKAYGLKQMKTQINDFRQYILGGGDPYRLLDFWK